MYLKSEVLCMWWSNLSSTMEIQNTTFFAHGKQLHVNLFMYQLFVNHFIIWTHIVTNEADITSTIKNDLLHFKNSFIATFFLGNFIKIKWMSKAIEGCAIILELNSYICVKIKIYMRLGRFLCHWSLFTKYFIF